MKNIKKNAVPVKISGILEGGTNNNNNNIKENTSNQCSCNDGEDQAKYNGSKNGDPACKVYKRRRKKKKKKTDVPMCGYPSD